MECSCSCLSEIVGVPLWILLKAHLILRIKLMESLNSIFLHLLIVQFDDLKKDPSQWLEVLKLRKKGIESDDLLFINNHPLSLTPSVIRKRLTGIGTIYVECPKPGVNNSWTLWSTHIRITNYGTKKKFYPYSTIKLISEYLSNKM